MFSHIMLGADNVQASKTFYDAAGDSYTRIENLYGSS